MDSQLSKEAPSPAPASKRPSLDSQDALGIESDVDTSSADMDGIGDGYRRRRAQLMAGLESGHAKGGESTKHRQYRYAAGTPDGTHMAYTSDDGSEFSSMSTSDDVELNRLPMHDGLTDEETGLTKKTKEHRKRRRRKAARLNERVAGSVKTSKQEQEDADWNVFKAMLINVSLIASWYLFSLSISIVGNCFQRQTNAG